MSLGRADWRFLLPPGRRELLAVFGDEDHGWLADDGWVDEVVSGPPADGRLADLVLVGDLDQLEAAVAVLAADGVAIVHYRGSPRRLLEPAVVPCCTLNQSLGPAGFWTFQMVLSRMQSSR